MTELDIEFLLVAKYAWKIGNAFGKPSVYQQRVLNCENMAPELPQTTIYIAKAAAA